MLDKLIYIPNDDKQNYPFCRLKLLDVKVWTPLVWNEPVNVSTVFEPTNKIMRS